MPPSLRFLPPEEWEALRPLFESSFPGSKLPPAADTTALVAEENGRIVAQMFLRKEFHMEPFCAEKGYGRTFPDMVKAFEEMLLERVGPLYYYCTAPLNEKQIEREIQLGRTPIPDHIPVVRRLGDPEF